MRLPILTLVAAGVALPTVAAADKVIAYEETHSIERAAGAACCYGGHISTTDITVDIPLFDGSLGTLDGVRMWLVLGDMTVTATLDNETAAQTGSLHFISDARIIVDTGTTFGHELYLNNQGKAVHGISLGSDSDAEPDFVGSDSWVGTVTVPGYSFGWWTAPSGDIAGFEGTGTREFLLRNGSRVGGGLFYFDAAMSVTSFPDLDVTMFVEYTYTPSCSTVDGVGCDAADQFGFEDAGEWSKGTSVTSPTTEGDTALSVTATGWTTIVSDPFSGDDLTPTSTLAVDVFIPTSPPNPYWVGTLAAVANCPTDGVYNAWLGQHAFTGKTLGEYHTLTFALSSAVKTALASSNDCTIELDLNAPSGGSPFIFDHLHFVP